MAENTVEDHEDHTLIMEMPDGTSRVWGIDTQKEAEDVLNLLTVILGQPDHVDD